MAIKSRKGGIFLVRNVMWHRLLTIRCTVIISYLLNYGALNAVLHCYVVVIKN